MILVPWSGDAKVNKENWMDSQDAMGNNMIRK